MGIGSITSMNSMSGMQMTMMGSTDPKSKSIQNEITDAQRQIQKLSSKDEFSVNEKMNERKKLQKEITSLNTELKQHQEELLRSQKRENMMAELQAGEPKDKTAAEKENKNTGSDMDTGLSSKGIPPAASADSPIPQADSQGTVITAGKDGIVILKDSMNQDSKDGKDSKNSVNTDAKKDGAPALGKTDATALPTGRQQADGADVTKEKSIPKKEEKNAGSDMGTYAGLSGKEVNALISADNYVQQANRQGTVIARIRGGIAILKEEIKQDESLGGNTEKKQEELGNLEKKEQRAATVPLSTLDGANNAVRVAIPGIKDNTQSGTANNTFTNTFKLPNGEDQEWQQQFSVSLGH